MSTSKFDTAPPSSLYDEAARKTLVSLHEDMSLDQVFTPRESRLVAEVRACCEQPGQDRNGELALALTRGFRSLGAITLAIEAYPSMRDRDRLGNRERDIDSLMKSLLEGGEHGLEWTLPTKAVLSRSFGIAKVNFFQSLRYALLTQGESARSLVLAVEESIEEAVFARMAEDLYSAFATSHIAKRSIRRVAIEHLVDLWESRIRFATYRFCPILRSAWSARAHTKRAFGTLMGTSEIMQLLFADCDGRFLDRFADESERRSDPATIELRQAFEEFLFDLPTESLDMIRERMDVDRKSCVDAREVAGYLGAAEALPEGYLDPRQFYRSFRQRYVHAQYRRTTGAEGPKRTAEAYVLESLLVEEAERRARDALAGE